MNKNVPGVLHSEESYESHVPYVDKVRFHNFKHFAKAVLLGPVINYIQSTGGRYSGLDQQCWLKVGESAQLKGHLIWEWPRGISSPICPIVFQEGFLTAEPGVTSEHARCGPQN